MSKSECRCTYCATVGAVGKDYQRLLADYVNNPDVVSSAMRRVIAEMPEVVRETLLAQSRVLQGTDTRRDRDIVRAAAAVCISDRIDWPTVRDDYGPN